MVGLSRKSMIYKSLKLNNDALNGTSVARCCFTKKSKYFEYDVKEAKESIELCKKLV